MLNVGIVGLGYVGLTLSVVAATKKLRVYGIDKNERILKSINDGKAHFYEKGLNRLISDVLNEKLFVSKTFNQKISYDLFVITVGTPLQSKKLQPEFDYIKQALKEISKVYTGDQLVILRSTVSVGVTRKIIISQLKGMLKNKESSEILVAFCPERTIEGNAIDELQSLPQIIGANNTKSYNIAESFFRHITPTILKVESLEASELIKLFNNTYRDVHFSIGNYFNEIAQSFGIDGIKLIDAANYNYDRSRIAKPGLVGGPCLGKDTYILVHGIRDSKGKDFVLKARNYNEFIEDKIVDWTMKKVEKLGIKSIGVSGLAFKGRPDNSDLRGSSSVSIVKKLNKKNLNLLIHDFLCDADEMAPFGKVCDNIYEMSDNLELLLILNNNIRYKNLDIIELDSRMSKPKLIFDCWMSINILNIKTKIKLITLGNMDINPD